MSFMAAFSWGVWGDMAAHRRTPGSIGVETELQPAILKRSSISMMYWRWESCRVRLERLRVTATPRRKEVGPSSLSLKAFLRAALTSAMAALDLEARVRSSTKTGTITLKPSERCQTYTDRSDWTRPNPISWSTES